jgi:hypothetical protein
MGLENVAIFPEGIVLDVKEPVFDAPMPATERQQPLRAGLFRSEAGDQIAQPLRLCPGRQMHDLGAHFGDLRQPWELTVAGQGRGDPHCPPLQAAMPLAHVDGVGWTWLSGKEEGHLGGEGSLGFLSRRT